MRICIPNASSSSSFSLSFFFSFPGVNERPDFNELLHELLDIVANGSILKEEEFASPPPLREDVLMTVCGLPTTSKHGYRYSIIDDGVIHCKL